MDKLLVIASNNQHKIKEFKKMLTSYEIKTMQEVGFNEDIEENGTTFFENCYIKAKTIHDYLKSKNIIASVLADDSGLCVNSLNGEPGIFSARYAGDHDDNEANRKKLLSNLKPFSDKTAYFNCCLVLIKSDGSYITSEGKTYGKIIEEEIGNKDFCYDCIFYSDDLHKTFGEATSIEKDSVSHRGKALLDIISKIN